MQIQITTNDIAKINSLMDLNSKAMIGAYNGMVESANHVTSYIKAQLYSPIGKSGKPYYEKRIGAIHIPSKPGEYPAKLTGSLAGSIDSNVSLDEVKIGSTLIEEYPSILEDYWDRSYLRRGIEENTSQIEDIIGNNIYQSLIG